MGLIWRFLRYSWGLVLFLAFSHLIKILLFDLNLLLVLYSYFVFTYSIPWLGQSSLGHAKNEEGALRFRSVIIILIICFCLKNIICYENYFILLLMLMFCFTYSIRFVFLNSLCRDNFIKQMMVLNTKIRLVSLIKILVFYLLNFAYNDEIVSLWTSDGLKALNL